METGVLTFFPEMIEYNLRFKTYACVAQLDRASGYGPEGRVFESCRTY